MMRREGDYTLFGLDLGSKSRNLPSSLNFFSQNPLSISMKETSSQDAFSTISKRLIRGLLLQSQQNQIVPLGLGPLLAGTAIWTQYDTSSDRYALNWMVYVGLALPWIQCRGDNLFCQGQSQNPLKQSRES